MPEKVRTILSLFFYFSRKNCQAGHKQNKQPEEKSKTFPYVPKRLKVLHKACLNPLQKLEMEIIHNGLEGTRTHLLFTHCTETPYLSRELLTPSLHKKHHHRQCVCKKSLHTSERLLRQPPEDTRVCFLFVFSFPVS